jgi:nicotinate-nucleotide pyrophosphorylase (carboxylating)
MSGIATKTHELVRMTGGKVLICSTRKTLWGLLDKKAVTVGGGGTHRLGLYDWMLVKDNHLEISDFSLRPELRPRGFQISDFYEIEVKNEKELKKALLLKPGAIMLDNFKSKNIKQILSAKGGPASGWKKHYPNIIIEASGMINEHNIRQYAKSGVDVISIGALTHSAKALDISLDIL